MCLIMKWSLEGFFWNRPTSGILEMNSTRVRCVPEKFAVSDHSDRHPGPGQPSFFCTVSISYIGVRLFVIVTPGTGKPTMFCAFGVFHI